MRHLVLSFTGMLLRADLDVVAQPDTLFFLGCARNHVMGTEEPTEVDWFGDYDDDDNEAREKGRQRWLRIREIVAEAEAKGRVMWRREGTERPDRRDLRDRFVAFLGSHGIDGYGIDRDYGLNYPGIEDALQGQARCIWR